MSRRGREAKSGTKRQTLRQRLEGFVFFALILGLIICYWIVSYYATDWLYAYIGKRPIGVLIQLFNSMGGVFLWAMTMKFMGKHFRSRQMEFYQTMVNAFRRMSRGDFNVSLENVPHTGPFMDTLVDSINHMAEELGQLEKMRQEFISNVSHEIQSPLTSISGFSRALKSDHISDEDRKHYLDIIEVESKRLSKLSDNLLKLTSLESQQHPFEPSSFRLDKQLRNHILACEPQWVDKEIEMDVDLEPVSLMGDEELLSQVWTNLIHNAIKFTPEGGVISVRLSSVDQESAVVQISDTGVGIAEADQPHIFERFYKADKARNRASGGNGLGLSIVKKILDMHQGSIQVSSQLAIGTVFTVRIPLHL